MAVQFSAAVRHAMLQAFETTVGPSPLLQLFSGAPPASCAAVDTGTKLAEGALPADFQAAPSGGSALKNGTWNVTGLAAAGAGTAVGHYRIRSTGGTVHEQGTVTVTGGGGDLQMTVASVANGQTVTVSNHTLTAPNP
jgi:hypothetical protein